MEQAETLSVADYALLKEAWEAYLSCCGTNIKR